MNYRDRLTPVLKIYQLRRLDLLASIGSRGSLYSELFVRQSAAFPLYARDGAEIRPAHYLDPALPALVAVLDLSPTANLGHPHLYYVWQLREASAGYPYRVSAEPFFHDFPLSEVEGVEEVEKEDDGDSDEENGEDEVAP